MDKDKLLGALYGSIIGDAVGVPFEFQSPFEIGPPEHIDIVFGQYHKDKRFTKTYQDVPNGTWSDDTSLMMSLLDALLSSPTPPWRHQFINNMVDWRHKGKFAVDSSKFDIGIQTSMAIQELQGMRDWDHRKEDISQGNGALMRNIAVLLAKGDTSIVEAHTRATHNNQMCVDINIIHHSMAQLMMHGYSVEHSLKHSFLHVEPASAKMVTDILNQDPNGSGWTVDCLVSTVHALNRGTDFRSVVQHAVSFGSDTDTTACVAGGLAGLIYGYSGIPRDWLDALRGKDQIEKLAIRMLEKHDLPTNID